MFTHKCQVFTTRNYHHYNTIKEEKHSLSRQQCMYAMYYTGNMIQMSGS